MPWQRHPSSDLRNADAARPVSRRGIFGVCLGAAASLALAWTKLASGQGVPMRCVPPPANTIPTPFVPAASLPVRIRKSVFELSTSEVDRLKAAYKALRDLRVERPDDPRNWLSQGVVHCWYCSGPQDGLSGPEIHGGWWFLPWHRAYLYFHERILGELIGDPSFTLPYWDWDSSGRNRFPDPYITPNDPGNPLFDAFRAIGPADRIPDNLVGTARMANVMGQATFDLFAGAGEGASGQVGAIEGAPHGGVHLWVTNPTELIPPQINMGVLGTAAFDPVFYAHHANIDRLWEKWLRQGNPSQANPSDDEWRNQSFLFYDQHRQWTSVQVADLVDTVGSLRYRYAPPTPGTQPAATVLAGGDVSSAPGQQPLARRHEIATLTEGDSPIRLTPQPVTYSVSLPTIGAATASASSPRRYILRIDGVEVPAHSAGAIRVFVNNPNADAATPQTDPTFAGSSFVLPRTNVGDTGQRTMVNLAFDITAVLENVANDEGTISVTLVPFQGNNTSPSDTDISYRRIYIASD